MKHISRGAVSAGIALILVTTLGRAIDGTARTLKEAGGRSGIESTAVTPAVVAALPAFSFDRGVVALSKSHGSELFGCSGSATVIFRFRVFSWDDGLHRINPSAFTVSAVDAARPGERIQIKVYKASNPAQSVIASAVSPRAATVGVSSVVNGDNIYVEASYPSGYLPGYSGS
ncbi:MAG TPA: hypothetical protein VN317_11025, partial [Candidatus Methanoperedens sp.]|nr:hypothetical protein [Candidatus Methanoperedens sp.]